MERGGRQHGWIRRRKKLLIGTLLILACAGVFVWQFDNFHTILPKHQVFGSAQLSRSSLEDRIERHAIRTVINLRGPNQAREWYREEIDVARRRGVAHFDFPLNSLLMPSRQEMIHLIDTLRTCAKPVLIHCESGIDRTGLAAMLCVLSLDEDGSIDQAWDQITIWRGHLPWRKTVDLKQQFLREYQSWLARNERAHAPEHFRQWVQEEYRGTYEQVHDQAATAPRDSAQKH